MTKGHRSGKAFRKIQARNKLRTDSQLPQLSVDEEIERSATHEERMAFEAFVRQQYQNFNSRIPPATGFMASWGRDSKIRLLIRQQYEALLQNKK